MTVSTVSDLNSLFNLIYEDALFVARETNMMSNLVTQLSARGWMDRKVGIYPEISAVAVGEDEDFTSPTIFDKTLHATLTPGETMSQVLLSDRRIDTDPDDARREAAQELGASLAKKIDQDLLGDFASFSTDKGPGAAGTATIARFAAAVTYLRNQNAPNPVYVVLHPYQWHRIWLELGQPAATKALLGDVANRALLDFYVGEWLQCQWFVSSNITADASDDAIAGVFNRQALALDVRKPPTFEFERDASKRAWEINASAGYAHGVWRSAFGVKYTSDASEPS